MQNDGFVGGWYNRADGLYYFDSTRLFPESQINEALGFGKKNGQNSVFVLSSLTEIPLDGKIADIVGRGTLIVGTTGDYRPLSFREPDGSYWGFGILRMQPSSCISRTRKSRRSLQVAMPT